LRSLSRTLHAGVAVALDRARLLGTLLLAVAHAQETI
jgi:hypothetical protein